MLEGLSHTQFIAAAYVIFFVVLGGLALVTYRRARAAKRYAEKLEDAAPKRQSGTTS